MCAAWSLARALPLRVLTHAGYDVLEAENGAHAVELFREHKEQIDAVLLDMVMPELDGWQAFLRIEALLGLSTRRTTKRSHHPGSS